MAVAGDSIARDVERAARSASVLLLGTGTVGSALMKLLSRPCVGSLRVDAVANSRWQRFGPLPGTSGSLDAGDPRDDDALFTEFGETGSTTKIVVDATPSADVARRHAEWLAKGYHVVTANKAAIGGSLADWQTLQAARASGARYGFAATVGAGLPILGAIERLRDCGDELVGIEGVFSGSLSYLFNHFDGQVPFSEGVRQARDAGYCESDPRADLSGEDVCRKLLILARSAGVRLPRDAVTVENLVPPALRELGIDAFLARMAELGAPLDERLRQARSLGRQLRYLARFDVREGKAHVGLYDVEPGHPATRLAGTDNQFVLTTRCYSSRPLIVQGPGAGPDVTAHALLGDMLDVLSRSGTRDLA